MSIYSESIQRINIKHPSEGAHVNGANWSSWGYLGMGFEFHEQVNVKD